MKLSKSKLVSLVVVALIILNYFVGVFPYWHFAIVVILLGVAFRKFIIKTT